MTTNPFRFPPLQDWRSAPVAVLIGLLLCVAMICVQWHSIATFTFYDPDDALRYVEVRDFISGQNWFDVSQHRVNPPAGGAMHWSRLVDLPIAAIMVLAGPALGDQLALVAVPMLLLLMLCVMTALAVDRLAGRAPAIVATVLIGLSLPILAQFRPMRVDHHGWQIVMAAFALWAAFDPQGRRGGIVSGLAVAFWAHVSSEGLPYAALFGVIFTIGFLRDRSTWEKLCAYAVTLPVASILLLLGTRGWSEASKPYCDAVSPVYLVPLVAASFALLASRYVMGTMTITRRAMIAAVAAAACIAAYLAGGDACRSGPFGSLDPIVYKYWYLQVMEGRPVWEQSPLMRAVLSVPPLIGIAGTLLAMVREQRAERRFQWLQVLLLALGAYAVSLFVLRAISVAYLMSSPGLAVLILFLLPKAQARPTAAGRIILTTALCGLTPLGISAIAATFLPDDAKTNVEREQGSADKAAASPCLGKATLVGLASLPRGVILAPIDQGPTLLAFTPHSVVATAHHRNNLAIRDLITAFMGSVENARSSAAQHHVSYVAYCPAVEVDNYIKLGPKGFMHALESGTPPSWLTPIKMRAGETIKVYRVRYDIKS